MVCRAPSTPLPKEVICAASASLARPNLTIQCLRSVATVASAGALHYQPAAVALSRTSHHDRFQKTTYSIQLLGFTMTVFHIDAIVHASASVWWYSSRAGLENHSKRSHPSLQQFFCMGGPVRWFWSQNQFIVPMLITYTSSFLQTIYVRSRYATSQYACQSAAVRQNWHVIATAPRTLRMRWHAWRNSGTAAVYQLAFPV